MLGRDEKNRVGCPDAFAKRRPFRRRTFVTILVVDGQLPYFDDAEFSPPGATSPSALATPRLIESFLRLPTITATSRILSI